MENKQDQSVEMVSEPSVESRFGFGKENRVVSPGTIKACALGTIVCLGIILVLRSPDSVSSNDADGIKGPDFSEMNQSPETLKLDSYSATKENARRHERRQRHATSSVRLPGLQKIERTSGGQIPSGSLVKAILVTGASNGPIKAEVQEGLKIRGETFVPQGAVLIGVGQSTEERLFVSFSQMILKDGSTQAIQAQAADADDKTIGLHGSKVGGYATKYAAAVGLNFVGGMAEGLQERQIVGGQQVVTNSDARNALLNGASKAALEMGTQEMANLQNRKPLIQIEAGKEILVMFDGLQ